MRKLAEHFLAEACESIDPTAFADAVSNLLESLAIRAGENANTLTGRAPFTAWSNLATALRDAADTFEAMAEGR
jgi:hypothetical protein